ncbi:MAG: hypothetical protein KDA53_00435 [Hyphomonas sp.]|nr:hypothetical protein [Hyphomonas sp.]
MLKPIRALGVLALLAQGAVAEAPKLASVFTDHMVIQRDAPITLFGTADAGRKVKVSLDDASKTVKAGKDGRWTAEFPALEAGGPHTLTLKAKSKVTQTVSDVLAGDVFLCSGQSNMEWPVSASDNGWNEMNSANNPQIRLLDVKQEGSLTPQDALPKGVAWEVTTPESAGDFSAVCYFTGRSIQSAYGVPVGLIDSSWGGSRIETWIGEEALAASGKYQAAVDLLDLYRSDKPAALAAYADIWTDWWKSHEDFDDREPWTGDATLDWQPTPDWRLSGYQSWGVPELERHLGQIWHRVTFTLTEEQAQGAAEVHIGAADDVDVTWLNGTPIGATHGWGFTRAYTAPEGVLKAGENTLVINVYNSYGPGGLTGPDEELRVDLADGSSVSLASGWTWLKVPADAGVPMSAPWYPIQGYAILHNGMIAPLGGLNLKGAIWYQGESNADAAAAYKDLLTTLMADWRGLFNADLPVITVELPSWGARPTEAGTDGWGSIRDSMRRAVAADDRAGLAVTVDIGDPANLHPQNKQDVAARVFRVARALFYGEDITGPSGPEVAGVELRDGAVRVDFAGVDKGLVTISSDKAIGFEACEADGTCRYVAGIVDGASVALAFPDGPAPAEIRFCQGASPLCNLYDGNGLPAGPFREAVTRKDP